MKWTAEQLRLYAVTDRSWLRGKTLLEQVEQALIGCPVGDIEKPINALRLVHSYDPCVSCAVHVSEPATGKHFETVTNPWGVK